MAAINELPEFEGLLNGDGILLPVCGDRDLDPIGKISIDSLVQNIRDAVLKGGEIEVYKYGFGIKFRNAGGDLEWAIGELEKKRDHIKILQDELSKAMSR